MVAHNKKKGGKGTQTHTQAHTQSGGRGRASIPEERVREMDAEVTKDDPKYAISQAALWSNDNMKDMLLRPDEARQVPFRFGHCLPEKTKALNQKKTGRCWIFAGLNVMRYHLIRRYELPNDFTLSHAYLYKCNMLERCNLAIEAMAAQLKAGTQDEVLSRRIIDDAFNDGGNIAQFVNLVEKYGVVPAEAFPESAQASNTRSLTAVLRMATVPRLASQNRDDTGRKSLTSRRAFEQFKEEVLLDCHRILTYALGSCPKDFEWQGKRYDPCSFHDAVVKPLVDVSQFVALTHDPRYPYDKVVYTPYGHNVLSAEDIGGDALDSKVTNVFLNVDMDKMRSAAFDTVVKRLTPVWFASEFGMYVLRDKGLMSLSASCLDDLFGVRFVQDKKAMLASNTTQPGHAMVFVGCHCPEHIQNEERAVEVERWKVENSHGDEHGDDGFLTMAKDYFDEFVLQVFVHPDSLPEELVQLYRTCTDPLRLPYPQAVA